MTIAVSTGEQERAATAVLVVLAAFFVLRPSIDVLATYDVGPNINLIAGASILLVLSLWTISMASRSDFKITAAGLAALTLGFSALLSSLGSQDLFFSTAMSLRVITAGMIFVACEQLAARLPHRVDGLTIAIVAGLASTAVFAAGQLIGTFPLPEGTGLEESRVPGPFPAPTVFATCMLIAVAMIVGLSPLWWRRQPNLIWILGPVAAGSTYLLVVNGSRSPLAALLIAVVVIAVAQRRFVLLLPPAVAGLAIVALSPSLLNRAFEVFDRSAINSIPGAEVNTFVFRVRYWQRVLPRFDESPLVGIGIGRVEQTNAEGFAPHSTTVQALVEMGLFGLLAHYALILILGVALFRALRRTSSLRVRAYLSCAAGLSVGYLAMSFFENLLTQVVTTAPLAALVGLALGLERHERTQAAATAQLVSL